MIACPGCGACLKYDIASGKMLCSYCSMIYDPYQFDSRRTGARAENVYDTAVYCCPSCGAELETSDNTDVAAFCSYCGGTNIIFDRFAKKKCPDRIIPFRITKDACRDAYVKTAKKAVFTASKYKKGAAVESFRGIYMPYWSLNVAQDAVLNTHGTKEYRSGDYIKTDTYRISGRVKSSYEGLSHDASRTFDDSLSECLAPFNVNIALPFTPGFLSGFYAEAASVEDDRYEIEAAKFAVAGTRDRLRSLPALSGIKTEDKALELPANVMQSNTLLLPVWFMSLRTGNKITYAAVNGQTGKVVADFPISPARLAGFTAVLAALIFALLSFVLFPTPELTVVLTTLLAVICCVMNVSEYSKHRRRDSLLADMTEKDRLDWASRSKAATEKLSFSFSFLDVILFFIALFLCVDLISSPGLVFLTAFLITLAFKYILGNLKSVSRLKLKLDSGMLPAVIFTGAVCVISIMVLIAKPLFSWYYYWSYAVVLFTFVLFFRTLRYHDQLTTRRPPQFNKTGGDDNA